MKKGEYIPRGAVLEILYRHRHQSRSSGYRHGLEQAAGIINSLEGINLEPSTMDITVHDDGKNQIKVGAEFRFVPSEAGDRIDDEGRYYIELHSRITEKACKLWRMYLTEEEVRQLEEKLHDLVEQGKWPAPTARSAAGPGARSGSRSSAATCS